MARDQMTSLLRDGDSASSTWKHLAAQLLVLRHDTLWIIDGAGPIGEAPAPEAGEQGDECKAQREQQVAQTEASPHPPETRSEAGDSAPSANPSKCPFSEEIPINSHAFANILTPDLQCTA